MSEDSGDLDTDNSYDYLAEDLSSSWNSSGLISALQYAFSGSLTDASPKASQPSSIKLPMKAHQLALLSAMKERELASMKGISNGSMLSYTNYGILGDSVGTGKSLVVLGHIAQMKEAGLNQFSRKILHPLSSPTFFSIVERKYSDMSGNSLIVVPHTLFRQWQTYCKAQTGLNVYFVKSAKSYTDLSDNELEKAVYSSDATLVSNTLYSEFISKCELMKIKWRRIFWDEADSIHITSTSRKPTGCFNWFITATWPNFLLSGFMLRPLLLNTILEHGEEKYHPDMVKWLREELGLVNYQPSNYTSTYGHGRVTWLRSRSTMFWKAYRTNYSRSGVTVLRTSNAFLETSRTMPPINDTILNCKQSVIQKVVSAFVSPEIQNMLNAGDIDSALEHLGVPADTPMSLLDAVTTQRNKKLDQLKKTLAFKQDLYANDSDKDKEATLDKLKAKIASLEEQNKSLKDRMVGIKDELCPICYDEPKSTTLTPCCSHIFCGACVIASLSRTPTCPLCRTPLQPSQLTRLTDEVPKKKKQKKTEEKDELLTKPKRLLKFLVENPSARVLVFSRYENPFSGLAKECEEAGITYTILKGNKDCIANTVKSFESGEKRVLFLPTQSAGAGMNLVGASHVVIYHAMTPEDEHQVIGRAYRLGRTQPLNVVRLLHEGETYAY